MKTLVIGGTGTVGSLVVRELLARKTPVRVLSRGNAQTPAGAEALVGNIGDPATLRPAFDGIEAVLMLNRVSRTEFHEGMMGVNGARAAGVKRFVYLSVHHPNYDPFVPHFVSKHTVEQALKASGIPYTILRPNNFFQNDLWLKDVILDHGLYPQPLGDKGCSRIDVRDIAEVAVLALTASGHENQTYDLVGPKVWTGAATAAAWSEALGKPVAYAGNDLDAWEKGALQAMPADVVYDFKLMFRAFHEKGLLGTPADVERCAKLLGHPPRRFEDFTKEVAATWSATVKS